MPNPNPVQASVFIATSLDGFIARPDGGLDWLMGDGAEGPHGYEEFIATVDAIVLGRNTYEIVLGFDAWPYHAGMPVFVLSGREIPPAPAGVQVKRLSGEPAEILTTLGGLGMQHVYVDGGITIQRFLRAGLIQRMVITRIPVLLGAGIPLFGVVDRDIRLERVPGPAYPGIEQSTYRVLPPA
jgi:dihydrofolate reductase